MSIDEVANAEFGNISPSPNDDGQETSQRNLELIYDLKVNVEVVLGKTTMTIRELLNLAPGSVVELDKLAGESIEILVNGMLIGKGEVVVINDNFGLRITDIVSSEERLKKI